MGKLRWQAFLLVEDQVTKPLSPAAQAVSRAACAAYWVDEYEHAGPHAITAAALRAVAAHVCDKCPWPNEIESIGTDWAVDELNAIADELEGQS